MCRGVRTFCSGYRPAVNNSRLFVNIVLTILLTSVYPTCRLTLTIVNRVLTMASHLISFRINDSELEALKQLAEGNESANLIAQRLLKERLGVSTGSLTQVSTERVEEVIEQVVSDRFSRLEAEVESLKKQLQIEPIEPARSRARA